MVPRANSIIVQDQKIYELVVSRQAVRVDPRACDVQVAIFVENGLSEGVIRNLEAAVQVAANEDRAVLRARKKANPADWP